MPDTTAVSVKNVSKQFDNVEVLRDINLTVEKGTVVSILGSSGSGNRPAALHELAGTAGSRRNSHRRSAAGD
jgi:ABC-type Fe3+/spermidine/putrescine transport system ATPase subunit